MDTGGQLEALVQLAQRATAAGRLDEAVRAWQSVVSAAPDHARGLFFLGQHALHRKSFAAARDFLERAEKAEPRDPNIPLNLAFAFRAMGDDEKEWAALGRALKIEPYFCPALLHQGMFLERTGRHREAAEIYTNVLKILPPGDQLPASLQSAVSHAQEVVKENAIQMEGALQDRLAPLRAKYAGEALGRFDECVDVAIGKKRVYFQQPSLLHFPQLPPVQFYDDAMFPWLGKLEAATDMIREELLVLLREDSEGFHPYVNHPDGVPLQQWRELNRSPRWSALHLWRDGKRNEEQCKRCPRTAALLDELPMLNLKGYGPSVLFSCLAPRTKIPAHTSVTNVRLVTHLPLIVPGQCFFRVGNETREWKEGKAWVFDDTFEHEAWNDSDKLRVILMLDIWNPHLTMAERELVTVLLNGVREYYSPSTPSHR